MKGFGECGRREPGTLISLVYREPQGLPVGGEDNTPGKETVFTTHRLLIALLAFAAINTAWAASNGVKPKADILLCFKLHPPSVRSGGGFFFAPFSGDRHRRRS